MRAINPPRCLGLASCGMSYRVSGGGVLGVLALLFFACVFSCLLGPVLGVLGGSWGVLGGSWGALGGVLGGSWGCLGGSWGGLGGIP